MTDAGDKPFPTCTATVHGEPPCICAAPVDPVCAFHGLRRSEHVCLTCCLCFRDITPEECHITASGVSEDVCNECAAAELEVSRHRALVRVPWRLRFRAWRSRRRMSPLERELVDEFSRDIDRRYLGL